MSLIGDEMDWILDFGPMNIWCEVEEDGLKTLLNRVHTVKKEVGSLVATNVINLGQRYTGILSMVQ